METEKRTRVGIVGLGFMGWIHWLAYQKISQAQIGAIVSRDPQKRAGDWTSIQGNFGPPGAQVDLADVAAYASLDELLADESIDLVDICLPPHSHAEAAVRALEGGKHVVCEKPMALSVADCDRMIQAAGTARRHLLVGHVLPFFPEYDFVQRAVAQGTYGRLLGGEFKRTISDPLWLTDFYDPDRVGGPLIDLHVHDAHFIRLLFGMPSAVVSSGRCRDGVVEYCATLFQYPDSQYVVSSVSGVIGQQGRPFTHGFEIHLERATIQFEFAGFADAAEAMPLKVLDSDGSVVRPALADGDPTAAFVPELEEVIKIVSGQADQSSILDGQLARDAIVLCHRQGQSVRQGRPMEI